MPPAPGEKNEAFRRAVVSFAIAHGAQAGDEFEEFRPVLKSMAKAKKRELKMLTGRKDITYRWPDLLVDYGLLEQSEDHDPILFQTYAASPAFNRFFIKSVRNPPPGLPRIRPLHNSFRLPPVNVQEPPAPPLPAAPVAIDIDGGNNASDSGVPVPQQEPQVPPPHDMPVANGGNNARVAGMPEQQEPPVPPPPGREVINLVDSDDEGQVEEVDIDNMTYEEMQVRFPGNGKKPASQEAISRLRRFRYAVDCAICQLEFKDSEVLITLDCTHVFHTHCINRLPRCRYAAECLFCAEEFKDSELLTTLDCTHVFHTHCINHWLSKEEGVCPLCKTPV